MESMGPIQLLVVAFDEPNFQGRILGELRRLAEADLVRIVDALVVQKSTSGVVTTTQFSDLTIEEAEEMGAMAGALLGLGIGDEAVEAGASAGIRAGEDGHLLDEADVVDVIGDIPKGSAAAVALLEHRWAIPLREAIIEANGMPVVDMWVHPLDLVAIGALQAESMRAES